MRINIKPLSVNQAWKGRRFKTKKYDDYIKEVLLSLGPMNIPEGDIFLSITFGLSSKLSDIDNPLKCFIDCLQKKYNFDDRRIFKINVEKKIVDKGSEFIDFSIYNYIQS